MQVSSFVRRLSNDAVIEWWNEGWLCPLKVLLALFVGLVRARPVPLPGDDAPVALEHGI